MSDRIQTKHPDPAKQGVRIDRGKYEAVRHAITDALAKAGEMTFTELRSAVEARLTGSFNGSIRWYYTTVKLDLEARGTIVRIPKSRPQRIRIGRKPERT